MFRAEPRGRDPRESIQILADTGLSEERASLQEKGPWLRETGQREAEWEREKLGEP